MALKVRAASRPPPLPKTYYPSANLKHTKVMSKRYLKGLISQVSNSAAPLWHHNAVSKKVSGGADNVVQLKPKGTAGGGGRRSTKKLGEQDHNPQLWAWLEFRNPPKAQVCWFDGRMPSAKCKDKYRSKQKPEFMVDKSKSYLNRPDIKPEVSKQWYEPPLELHVDKNYKHPSVLSMCRKPDMFVPTSVPEYDKRTFFMIDARTNKVITNRISNETHPEDKDIAKALSVIEEQLYGIPGKPWTLVSHWFEHYKLQQPEKELDITAFSNLDKTCAYHGYMEEVQEQRHQRQLKLRKLHYHKEKTAEAHQEWYNSRQYSYWRDMGINEALTNPNVYLPAKMYARSCTHSTLKGTTDDVFYTSWLYHRQNGKRVPDSRHGPDQIYPLLKMRTGFNPEVSKCYRASILKEKKKARLSMYQEMYNSNQFVGPMPQPKPKGSGKEVVSNRGARLNSPVLSDTSFSQPPKDFVLKQTAKVIAEKAINEMTLCSLYINAPPKLISKMLDALTPGERDYVLSYKYKREGGKILLPA